MYECKYALRWNGDNVNEFSELGLDCILKFTKESGENGKILHLVISGTYDEVATLSIGDAIVVSTNIELVRR